MYQKHDSFLSEWNKFSFLHQIPCLGQEEFSKCGSKLSQGAASNLEGDRGKAVHKQINKIVERGESEGRHLLLQPGNTIQLHLILSWRWAESALAWSEAWMYRLASHSVLWCGTERRE